MNLSTRRLLNSALSDPMKTVTNRMAVLALLLGATACRPAAPQEDLKAVKVPPGFTFQTSRSVGVRISGSATVVPPPAVGHLVLKRLDGQTLFDGHLVSGADTTARLALPTKDGSLVATLVLPNGQTMQQEIPVIGGMASHAF